MQLTWQSAFPNLLKALLGSTLFGISATAPARAEDVQALAIQGDTYLSAEMVDGMSTPASAAVPAPFDHSLSAPIATADGLGYVEDLQESDLATLFAEIRAQREVVALPAVRLVKGD